MTKKFIVPMLAILVVSIALAASAFKTDKHPKEAAKFQDHYFRFDGDDNSNAEIQASGNWVDLGTNPPSLPCEETSGIVCYVKYNGELSAYQSYVSNKTITDLQTAGIIEDYRE